MYKTAYDVLTQVTLISKNVSKNCQVPFGVRLKELAYESCKLVGSVYDVKGEERRVLIERALPMCEELCFLLQFLKDIALPAACNRNGSNVGNVGDNGNSVRLITASIGRPPAHRSFRFLLLSAPTSAPRPPR